MAPHCFVIIHITPVQKKLERIILLLAFNRRVFYSFIQRDGLMDESDSKGIYYGWFIVAASFSIIVIGGGIGNSLGVFALPMSNEFGWSRTLISSAVAVGILVSGFSQAFCGHIHDLIGGRRLIILGILFVGITTMLLSLTSNYLYFLILFGIVRSALISSTSITTIGVLLAKWFRKRRATAISIASSGGSVGGLLIVPFSTYLIIVMDWRFTWVILGLIMLIVVLPTVYLILKNEPRELGLYLDGHNIGEDESGGETLYSEKGPLVVTFWKDAFKSYPIWQLCGGYFVCGFTTLIMSFHFVPYAIESGFSPATAAMAFGVLSIMNTFGVLIVGPIADKLGNKNILGIVYAIRGIGYALLLSLPGQYGLWAFAIFGGVSWIASVPLTTSLTTNIYGLKKSGTLTGLVFMSHQIGGSIGIQFGGVMRDLTGSYFVPFFTAGLMLVLASIISLAIQETRYSSTNTLATDVG